MAAKFQTDNSFKKITFDEVVDFLEKNGTAKDKSDFKKACFTDKLGNEVKKLNWLNGKLWFCNKFAPELVPEKKTPTELKSERIANW